MIGIHEIFETMQCEGGNAGRPAIFVRLAGCNLWSGNEEKRGAGRGVCAKWCDTDFRLTERMTVEQVVDGVRAFDSRPAWVVITGGEPMLQHAELVKLGRRLWWFDYKTAIETNGTIAFDVDDFDHVCVSPKALVGVRGLDHIKQRQGDELKVIVPLDPEVEIDDVRRLADGFEAVFVQPRDTGNDDENRAALQTAIDIANQNDWRVSIQYHKYIGIK